MELIRRKILLVALPMIFLGVLSLRGQSFRILSMNMKEGGQYAGYKAAPYAAFIKEYDPDFVCLQEVDMRTIRSKKTDILDSLALQTGMFPFFCKSFDYQEGGFGVAILSKYPFYRVEKTVVTLDGAREPRGTAWVYVQLPDGSNVRVGSVHLAVESNDLAIKQWADVSKKVLLEKDIPTILAGDFNCPPDGATISYVSIKWQEIARGSGPTIPSTGPTTQLDYMMGYPKGGWKWRNYKIIPRSDLSDHCFIVADLSYEAQQ